MGEWWIRTELLVALSEYRRIEKYCLGVFRTYWDIEKGAIQKKDSQITALMGLPPACRKPVSDISLGVHFLMSI